jgi:ABC-2 type transport system ATP-binding protein
VAARARRLGPLSAGEELLRADGAGCRFRRGRIGLEPTDLTVRAGEIVALLGPNGAGKTTLLRLLARDLLPGSGSIQHGTAVTIGFAADESVHVDELSGRANARCFARAHGAADAEADAWLAQFGLQADAHVPAGEYSFGMRRKLMLVEALAHSPAVLLLDEPTLGLDPAATGTLAATLQAHAAKGGATVFATNDLAAATLATRIVFLHHGRMVADAPPAELMRGVAGKTRIEVALEGPPVTLPDFADDIRVAGVDGAGCTFETTRASALPEICAALLQAGAHIRSVRVREPDLGDAFRQLTGEDLRTGVEPA